MIGNESDPSGDEECFDPSEFDEKVSMPNVDQTNAEVASIPCGSEINKSMAFINISRL